MKQRINGIPQRREMAGHGKGRTCGAMSVGATGPTRPFPQLHFAFAKPALATSQNTRSLESELLLGLIVWSSHGDAAMMLLAERSRACPPDTPARGTNGYATRFRQYHGL